MNARPMSATPRVRPILWAAALLATLAVPAAAQSVKEARAALEQGRLDEAMQLFERAAQDGSAEGRAGVGQVWLRRRQLARAQEAFETAQKMDPMLAAAYWGQGEVLKRQGRCAEAIPLLQKANELDRKYPDAAMSLGRCLIELKRIDEAIPVLTQGTRWGPKWRPKFLVALGDAELARDSLRSASVFYTQAREEAPGDPVARRALGDFYLKARGIGELAVPEYEAAVAIDSTDVELRFALAQGLFYAQRYNAALEQYRWVVERDPEFAPGLLGLGNLYFLSGPADPRRYADAVAPLEAYVRLEPQDGRGWSLLGRTYFYLQRRDEAVKALEKAESLGAGNKEMFTILGRLYAAQKEWSKSLAAFARGEPTTRDQLTMAQVYVFEKQPERADSIYRAVVAIDSTTADARFALYQLGLMRFRALDYAGAASTFRRVIGLDPKHPDAYYYLGLSYKELKQAPEALDALRQAAAITPDKADRHFWLGVMFAQSDSVEAARAALARSVELDSTSKVQGVAFRQLGFYDLVARRYAEAIRHLERAVQLDEKDVQAWVWLGQGQQNTGNRGRALEAYRRALALDPRQADALKGIQALEGSASR
uniref:Tetratricopeptide repeat protein n=1 Tax=Eiseniibacteriota bacterium TaxID=2212470 RepID=A0A832I1R4_UNCEI